MPIKDIDQSVKLFSQWIKSKYYFLKKMKSRKTEGPGIIWEAEKIE